MSHFYDDLTTPEAVSVVDELPFWSAPFGLRLLDVVRYKRNICALDIGCGLGFPMIELSMRLGNTSRVYGIDPWKAATLHLRQKIKALGLSNVAVVNGLAEKMPFADEYFDLIVSNNGINNVADIEKTFEECRRVAKPGCAARFYFQHRSNIHRILRRVPWCIGGLRIKRMPANIVRAHILETQARYGIEGTAGEPWI